MKIVHTEALPEFEYFKEETKKSQIVLHHTVSSIGKYVDDWFKEDKGKSKVAVAYVVDKDGTIFQLFNPRYWAYHIGKGSSKQDNKNSIGIELVNEGTLEKKDDKFYWFDGKYEYKGNPYIIDESWRNVKYFASYTKEQVSATMELVEYLIQNFGLPRNFSNTFNYDRKYFTFRGIVMHCNLREDKTDLSPAFPIRTFNKFIEDSKIIQMNPIPVKELPFDSFLKQSQKEPTYYSSEVIENKNVSEDEKLVINEKDKKSKKSK